MPSRCVKCFRWKLLSYEDFFLHAVDGVQVEPMVSRETRPQHQVKKSSHCIAWKYGTSFILGICSLFCILLEQYFPVYLYPFDILLDGEKHSTMTCQSLGPKPIKLEVTLPTIGPLHLPQRRGVGSWIHYDLKLRVIIYHSYLFLLLPTSIGREWIIRSTKWRNKHGQVRLLY